MQGMINGRVFLTDEVYNRILIHIAEGKWKAGEKIPSEKTLCEMFNVSRVSVRAVLQRLKARGLIYTMQGVGSFVAKPEEPAAEKTVEMAEPSVSEEVFSTEDILAFFEFRQAIEFKAIDLFIARARDADYTKLLEIIRVVQNCQDDFQFICQCDVNFHTALVEATGNRYLIDAMAQRRGDFYQYVERLNRIVLEDSDSWVKAHTEIYQGLINKQPNVVKRVTLEANAIRKLLISENEHKRGVMP